MQITVKPLMWITYVCVTLIVGSPLFLLTGCKPSREKISAQESLLGDEIEALFVRVQEMQSGNQVDEAIQLIDRGLVNPKYKGQKARFFTQKIQLMLVQNKDQMACALINQTLKSEPELARAGIGDIYNHYQQRNSHPDIRKWCKSLLEPGSGLPKDLLGQVLNWQLSAALAMADENGAENSLDEILSALTPEDAAPMIQRNLGDLIDAGQQKLVSALLRHLESKKLESPLYSNLFVTLSVRCVLAAKDWLNMTPAFNASVAQLPDDQLLKLSRTVFPVLQKNGQPSLMEQFSKQMIDHAIEKTNSVNYASRVWVENGVTTNKKMLPDRLETLLNAKVSPIQVGNLFDRYFYEMTDDLEIIRSLCSLGERILAVCSDEATVNNVKVKILDGAFITDNFDLAVHMLEQGIPGKDKAWHDMSLPKVKAHRAMAQKNPREAVQYFRDFMNAWIASDQKEEFDPTSGIAYSREWILGRNANRIASILDTIPDKAEADKARAEAKGYFKTAIEKAAGDAEASKLLKEETKKMGL